MTLDRPGGFRGNVVEAADVEDTFPLTSLQQGLLFHSLADVDGGDYLNQLVLRLRGQVDVDALVAAWEALLARHAVLRASVVWEGVEEPMHVVASDVRLPVVRDDWSGLTEPERQQRLDALLEADRAAGLDLRRPPVMRLSVVRFGPDSTCLVWTFHHLFLDGWSLMSLLGEVGRLYAAAVHQQPVELEVRRPFRDYVDWLVGRDQAAAENFWRGYLAGFDDPTPLPLGFAPSGTGRARYRHRLDAAQAAAVDAFARTHQVTVATLVQAAWGLLLGCESGRADVVFGVASSGRSGSLRGLPQMIGLFINTLPVRIRIDAATPALAWLRALQDASVQAARFEYLPLTQLHAWTSVPRGSALFESIVAVENYPIEAGIRAPFEGVAVEHARLVEQTNYPLSLSVFLDGAPEFELRFDADRFDEASAARLMRRFADILTGLVTAPESPVGSVLSPSRDEQRELMSWSRGEGGVALPAPSLHRAFEAHARRAPDAIAVTCHGRHLSYGALNRRANALARRLRARGVGPATFVGVCMDRRADLVTAILGVLKAGAAYLPLDPVNPQERLVNMIADAGVDVVVGATELLGWLPRGVGAIYLDEDAEPAEAAAVGSPDGDDLPGTDDPHALAYAMYTSGSTGRPKAVQVTHANVLRLFASTEDAFRFGPNDVWTLFHSYAFDFSVWEMWGALLYGGRLVIENTRSPEDFLELLDAERVTVLNQTPSAFGMLCVLDRRPAHLRLVIFGGEPLDRAQLRVWWSRPGGDRPRLVNMYGITETTVHVTHHSLTPDDAVGGPGTPIGQPIRDLDAYVLDAGLGLVPVGVAGELFVGGVGLARGYLGRGGLTAERFVPDPFGAVGGRLYRTGDRVRWLPGGVLEFLGRLDAQVKIRGVRVEPGEVEAVLAAHPQVGSCVVAARPGPDGAVRLVAWVVPVVGGEVDVGVLRRFLGSRLPPAMVPSLFAVVDALPLTAGGKVDRRALPDPDPGAGVAGYVAPRSSVEATLVGIWQAVLGVARVGVEDDFFELGGHSLLAVRLLGRVRAALGVELSLRTVLEARTVAGLALCCAQAPRVDGDGPALVAVPRVGSLPLSFAQQRLWFLQQLAPESSFYNSGAPLRCSGVLDVAALARALMVVVRRHEVLRTTFPVRDGVAEQVVSADVVVPLPVTDLSGLPVGDRVAAAVRVAGQCVAQPFDLARGPLLRARLLRLAERDHVLVLAAHHTVCDGWSLRVLVDELMAAYRSESTGSVAVLPELPVQYADYAVWQRRVLTGEALTRRLAYWQEALRGAPQVLELPTDGRRPAVQRFAGGEQPVRLSPQLVRAVREFGRGQGATTFMVVLAAFQALLYRLTGQRDFLVGAPVSGRQRPEVARLVGLFVNTVVLRAQLDGGISFRELVRRAREVVLGADEHADLPFDVLVERLQPQRDLSRSPLVQVMVSYQDQPGTLSAGGLTLRPLPVPRETSAFDLVLALDADGDQVSGGLVYNCDVISAATAQRWARWYARLLEAAVAEPDTPVEQLPMYDPDHMRQLLTWSVGASVGVVGGLVHELVGARVRVGPGVVAVECGQRRLSYGQLWVAAGVLARRLVGLGVGPESRVGVLFERSVESVVALLGVLRAGAAYVPLDPQLPDQRLGLQLADAAVRVVVCGPELAGRLPGDVTGVPFTVADHDADHGLPDDPDGAVGLPRVDPDGLGFVFFTSGSTGRPKAVGLAHRGLCNRLLWMQRVYGLTAADRVALKTSVGFDVSLWEFLWPLIAGARVVVVPPGMHREPAALVGLLADRSVTVTHFVPSLLELVAAEPGLARCRSLRLVVASGEVLPAGLAQRLLERLPWARLDNLYGPTEASIDVSAWRAGVPVDGAVSVPIGRPVDNMRLLVLDAGLGLVPVGVAGELFVGGVGLARGYLGRGGLTAERFVPDPFGAVGGRLYRTGDRVRWLPGGVLEFLGRLDAQVKIRGVRVEPGEVEAVLAAHPQVGSCVVAARPGPDGAVRLVAWVQPSSEPAPTPAHLRRWLDSRLPQALIPAGFMTVTQWPLTPSGKIDRKALPDPPVPTSHRDDDTPRTATEQVLTGIWQDVLGIDHISPTDDFFHLGGHSIAAARVIAQVRKVFRQALSLRAFFVAPTVRGMADALVEGADQATVERIATIYQQVAAMSADQVRESLRQDPTTWEIDDVHR